MAILEKSLGTVSDPTGATATLYISYDDVSLLLTQFRVDNQTSMGAYAEATAADGTVVSKTFAAHTNTTQTIPAPIATKYQLHVDSRGRLDGVNYAFRLV